MKSTIPWIVARDVSARELARRSLKIMKRLLKPPTYEKIALHPDARINATCFIMFNTIAPKGFIFGFHDKVWGFHRTVS